VRKSFFAIFLLLMSSVLTAQQALNNDSIIKLTKAGLTEDLIISTINSTPGSFNTSVDGIIALKSAGVADKVVAALVSKGSNSTPAYAPVNPPSANGSQAAPTQIQSNMVAPMPGALPRIFLTSSSKGTNQNAARDQSMEMSKDFERDCPSVKITINQANADYTVALNHIEVGLLIRDNQIQIANRDGDLISKTKEGGSIAGAVKKACTLILSDYSKKS